MRESALEFEVKESKRLHEITILSLESERKRLAESGILSEKSAENERRKLMEIMSTHQHDVDLLNQNHRLEMRNVGELQRQHSAELTSFSQTSSIAHERLMKKCHGMQSELDERNNQLRNYKKSLEELLSEQEHLKILLVLETKKVMEMEDKILMKETIGNQYNEEKIRLKSAVLLLEDDLKNEKKSSDYKLNELKERSSKELQSSQEKVLHLESALRLSGQLCDSIKM